MSQHTPPRAAIIEWNDLHKQLEDQHQALNESMNAQHAIDAIYKLLVILPAMNHELHRLKAQAENNKNTRNEETALFGASSSRQHWKI